VISFISFLKQSGQEVVGTRMDGQTTRFKRGFLPQRLGSELGGYSIFSNDSSFHISVA
jgi:hypothetical protein